MTEARQRILARVRAALGPPRETAERARAEALAGLDAKPHWSPPRLERFLAQFERAAGSYAEVDDVARVVDAVQAYFEDSGAPRRLFVAPHPWLQALDWPDWAQRADLASAADWPAAVTVARAGIAETGSLVLPSSAHSPASLNFLPDHHLVVLRRDAVVDYLEDALALVQAENLPRTVNLVTGPSRTADIEQTLQLGAHGPRRLHLILVG